MSYENKFVQPRIDLRAIDPRLKVYTDELHFQIKKELTALQEAIEKQTIIKTIAGSGSSSGSGSGGSTSGYATVQDEGVSLPQRTKLNFIGDQVTASDDVTNSSTDVTVTQDVTITMVDTVSAFDVVTSTGKKADSTNTAYKDKVIGLATTAITGATSGLVRNYGQITNATWTWSPGDVLYLNGTALSTTAPTASGFVQEIARALTSITIMIELKNSILL